MQTKPSKAVKENMQTGSAQVPAFNPRLSRAERYDMGKRLREACPRSSHALWKVPSGRTDPVKLTLAAEAGRMPELLPLRHGRMVASPFTFYRGSAGIMAADLAATPASGVRVQACGDAHLSNFGGFATPERQVIFSINDLDETLHAPWEWDIKRLAASFVVACRDNGLGESTARDAVLVCVKSYREHMAEYSEMKTLELWYEALNAETLISSIKDPALRRRAIARLTKESARSIAEDIFPKLASSSGESRFIKDQLPTIFHWEGHTPGEVAQVVKDAFALYRETLAPAYQVLLDRYELRDAAIKVVGIGSVGTRCWVLLLTAGEKDPLFLQVKEARSSVLEPYAGKSEFPNHGQRVVNGQRLMQPYSDMFLGWTEGSLKGLHYYFRQLRDIKISIRVETFGAAEMNLYAQWCGQALALAHARSGDAALISGYLGKSDAFDQALAAFSVAYADQNEKDHAAFKRAIRGGKVKASFDKAEGE
jgi:uncharacterized protein (DUF2252 family)